MGPQEGDGAPHCTMGKPPIIALDMTAPEGQSLCGNSRRWVPEEVQWEAWLC